MIAVGPRRALVLGGVLAALFAVALAQSVYNIPIQVSDGLDVILDAADAPSSWTLFLQTSQASSTTLRPGRYLQARWLSQIAEALRWPYHAVFRGTHAMLAVAIVGLFAWVARVRRLTDVAALAVALTVLAGHHTFGAMLREAYPVNHYAEVACAALVTLGIAQRRPTIIGQLLPLVLLAAGLFLIESAVLLWVTLVGCVAMGLPGLRRSTAAVATVLLVLYLGARPLLGIQSPGIGGHESGWMATTYGADDLVARFGANPWPFYAYNVTAGALSVVASEPRFGVYRVLVWRGGGSWPPVLTIHLVSSVLVSLLILACAGAHLRRPWTAWPAEARLLALAAVVLGASSVLCLTYVKDEIVSTAGVFYALAAYGAVGWALDGAAANRRQLALAVAVLIIAAPLWAFRVVGTHYELRRTAFTTRNDWALNASAPPGDTAAPATTARFHQLRAEALRHRVTSPSFLPDWGERYWIE